LKLLGRILANAMALVATTVVPGIEFTGGLVSLLVSGALFGLFNLIVRPVAVLLSFPMLVLTLGVFYLVLNGLLLWLASAMLPGYRVDGALPGIAGGLIVTVVNWAIGVLTEKPAEGRRPTG
jgi:putative membrane protein